jgi:hypothetical protein
VDDRLSNGSEEQCWGIIENQLFMMCFIHLKHVTCPFWTQPSTVK